MCRFALHVGKYRGSPVKNIDACPSRRAKFHGRQLEGVAGIRVGRKEIRVRRALLRQSILSILKTVPVIFMTQIKVRSIWIGGCGDKVFEPIFAIFKISVSKIWI